MMDKGIKAGVQKYIHKQIAAGVPFFTEDMAKDLGFTELQVRNSLNQQIKDGAIAVVRKSKGVYVYNPAMTTEGTDNGSGQLLETIGTISYNGKTTNIAKGEAGRLYIVLPLEVVVK